MTVDPQAWEKSLSSLGGQLVTALKPVAAKLGVAAEHMYVVLVRQTFVESLACLVGWGAVAVGFFIASSHMSKFVDAEWTGDSREQGLTVSWLVFGIGLVIAAMTLSINLPGIINPEYGAIKTLIDAVSTKGACP
jgi:hypothetical protein